MPFSWFPFKRGRQTPPAPRPAPPPNRSADDAANPAPEHSPPKSYWQQNNPHPEVLRYFYNLPGSQTYASFFRAWDGILTAGHVMSDTNYTAPPFASDAITAWPDGLDAAILGCTVPRECPAPPHAGQEIVVLGYPAGSRHIESRTAKVYMPRPASPGVWIARIIAPDEPVVVGMSGGPVVDAASGAPIGILITRNSPADLDRDDDPDESFDFVSLAGLWKALYQQQTFV